MANFVNQSTIGVNLQGNSDGATALFGLGQHVQGNNGSEWVYVNAIAALTTGQLVTFNTLFSAQPATATLAYGSLTSAPQVLAFAQGAFAALDYGWVAIRGYNMAVNLSSSSTFGVALYIANTGGVTSYAAASGTLAGVLLTTCSATGVANAATTAFLTYPRLNVGAALGQ